MKKIKYMLFLFLVIFITGCKKTDYIMSFTLDENDNTVVVFGRYPQTLEKNEKVINELNNYKKPKWKFKEYYVCSKLESIMKYTDIDLDKDGKLDYRGVVYSKYKPVDTTYDSDPNFSYLNDYDYELNVVYWFKYEYIKWKWKKYKDRGDSIDYLLVSLRVLDSMEFYPSDSTIEFKHNGKVGYSNNYELSSIRKWLNNEFYNMAFSPEEKDAIVKMKIDNSGVVVDNEINKYACSNTRDKVFIQSYSELKDYKDSGRKKHATDYAKIEGVYTFKDNACYMLRTPSMNKENSTYYVDYDGAIHGDGVIFINKTTYTFNGVVPCLIINVSK